MVTQLRFDDTQVITGNELICEKTGGASSANFFCKGRAMTRGQESLSSATLQASIRSLPSQQEEGDSRSPKW